MILSLFFYVEGVVRCVVVVFVVGGVFVVDGVVVGVGVVVANVVLFGFTTVDLFISITSSITDI